VCVVFGLAVPAQRVVPPQRHPSGGGGAHSLHSYQRHLHLAALPISSPPIVHSNNMNNKPAYAGQTE
jgi:hypothetical protein